MLDPAASAKDLEVLAFLSKMLGSTAAQLGAKVIATKTVGEINEALGIYKALGDDTEGRATSDLEQQNIKAVMRRLAQLKVHASVHENMGVWLTDTLGKFVDGATMTVTEVGQFCT